MSGMVWLALVAAAVAEVGGDALIRYGLHGKNWLAIVGGGLVLAGYGVLVNLSPWDFGKLLGIYVAFFAMVAVGWGWLVFHEKIPLNTLVGLMLIVAGSLVIQFGLPFATGAR